MGVYIKGMEMPTTGLYFVSVDNTDGRDKTIVTVERMLGNRDARQVVGSFELAPVPTPHGRLIDADKLLALVYANIALFDSTPGRLGADQKLVRAWLVSMADDINDAPTIIPAEESE